MFSLGFCGVLCWTLAVVVCLWVRGGRVFGMCGGAVLLHVFVVLVGFRAVGGTASRQAALVTKWPVAARAGEPTLKLSPPPEPRKLSLRS